jgi:predicted ATPase
MPAITKLMLQNFKQFPELDMDFNPGKNVLIGDNETGKSTVLLAIDLVNSASRSRVETIGLEALINRQAVVDFLSGEKKISDLPVVLVDLFLQDGDESYFHGRQNQIGDDYDGIRMKIAVPDDYHLAIKQMLEHDPQNFPFEYYTVTFHTFAGEGFNSYRRPLKHLHLDSSRIDSEYAAREYTRTVFGFHAEIPERHRLENLYRRGKEGFRDSQLGELNKKLPPYEFGIRTSTRANLETDLVITKEGISIENRGKGEQCFIKTEFALGRRDVQGGLDVLLLEEPENHLSHTNMKRLVERLVRTESTQLFVATHSSHICSRLDLRHALLLGTSQSTGTLKALSDKTAGFFMKAPDNNVLEFALSKKVILVEGDAEFILMEELYKRVSGGATPQSDHVHIISIGGTSFKRYLELASLLNIKVAAIRDNDKNYQQNCVDNYSDHVTDSAQIFADKDPDRYTFEIGMYLDNQKICDELFGESRKTLTVQDYMLKNKAETAYELLDSNPEHLSVPGYIQEAITWIRK